jgi:hypothetical protein
MRRGFESGAIHGSAAASLLAIALAFAGGCETGHTTPDFGANPPPPPTRMPRAIEMSTGVQLLSSELSEEEAEKLKQGAADTEADAEPEPEAETATDAEGAAVE